MARLAIHETGVGASCDAQVSGRPPHMLGVRDPPQAGVPVLGVIRRGWPPPATHLCVLGAWRDLPGLRDQDGGWLTGAKSDDHTHRCGPAPLPGRYRAGFS